MYKDLKVKGYISLKSDNLELDLLSCKVESLYETGVLVSFFKNKTKELLFWDKDYIKLEKAYGFAKYWHTGQMRKYAELPYIIHPVRVAELVRSFTSDIDMYNAAMLHDTVEDTGCTLLNIMDEFNANVADLVWGCTNPSQVDSNYSSLPRKQRKEIDLKWIIANPHAHLIKALDIVDNMNSSLNANMKYMQTKVVPEKLEVLENLKIPDNVRALTLTAIENIGKIKW